MGDLTYVCLTAGGWLYTNLGPNSTNIHVVLSWAFDNNTYETSEGNHVCLCPINAAFANFLLERFQLSPRQLAVF